MNSPLFDRRPLIDHLRGQFSLDWQGIHGVEHWTRVSKNGARLSPATDADPLVVDLFAWLHDSRRLNEGFDPEHGQRAAELASELRGEFFELSDEQFEILCTACRGHSDGLTAGDPTVLTCWDADRLDLARLSIRPDPKRLCTEAARTGMMIDEAWARARPARLAARRGRRRRD